MTAATAGGRGPGFRRRVCGRSRFGERVRLPRPPVLLLRLADRAVVSVWQIHGCRIRYLVCCLGVFDLYVFAQTIARFLDRWARNGIGEMRFEPSEDLAP